MGSTAFSVCGTDPVATRTHIITLHAWGNRASPYEEATPRATQKSTLPRRIAVTRTRGSKLDGRHPARTKCKHTEVYISGVCGVCVGRA